MAFGLGLRCIALHCWVGLAVAFLDVWMLDGWVFFCDVRWRWRSGLDIGGFVLHVLYVCMYVCMYVAIIALASIRFTQVGALMPRRHSRKSSKHSRSFERTPLTSLSPNLSIQLTRLAPPHPPHPLTCLPTPNSSTHPTPSPCPARLSHVRI